MAILTLKALATIVIAVIGLLWLWVTLVWAWAVYSFAVPKPPRQR